MKAPAFLLFALLASACSKTTPSTATVCGKLVAAGVAANCHPQTPKVINALAREQTEFDLPSVPGHGGAVLGFDKDSDYDGTVKAYEAAAALAGPYRFGNATARVFVQMNDGASPDIGEKARAVVAGL